MASRTALAATEDVIGANVASLRQQLRVDSMAQSGSVPLTASVTAPRNPPYTGCSAATPLRFLFSYCRKIV